jgi:hypothetical protein
MRCPKCAVETPNEALCCPNCKLPTPRGKTYLKDKKARKQENQARETKRGTQELKAPNSVKEKKHVPGWVTAVSLVLALAIFGAGSYFAATYWPDMEAKTEDGGRQLALDRVRQSASKQSGMTIEDFLNEEVNKLHEAGRLLEKEGWQVKPLDGKQFLVSFSFEDKDKQQKRAAWKVDLNNNSLEPQTDLAKDVIAQQ